MTIDELVDAVNYSRETLQEIISELTACMFVERTESGAVKLSASGPEETAALGQLAELWARDPVVVARTLSAMAVARIRDMAEHSLIPNRRKK